MLATAQPATAKSLSFVVQIDAGLTCFWAPDRGGDYATECARGRAYADEMLAFIRAEQHPTVFSSVMRAITEGKIYSAVEIGFCSRIGVELLGL